jgi:hypothetical protein
MLTGRNSSELTSYTHPPSPVSTKVPSCFSNRLRSQRLWMRVTPVTVKPVAHNHSVQTALLLNPRHKRMYSMC